jgi:hypothetical protein
MKRSIALALVLLLIAPGLALAKKKHRRAAPQAQQQIACTFNGCVRVPRGCYQRPGKTWTDEPTGMDEIVCLPGVQPFP